MQGGKKQKTTAKSATHLGLS